MNGKKLALDLPRGFCYPMDVQGELLMSTITIPKNVTHGDELVIVRRKDYEELHHHLAEVKDALAKIRRGNKELFRRRTRITTKSLSELRSA